MFIFFFFTDPATSGIYTLSLHDALPICQAIEPLADRRGYGAADAAVYLVEDHRPRRALLGQRHLQGRSEEHTSELQSPDHLVCRLLLEKKNKTNKKNNQRRSKTCRSTHR